MDKRIAQLQQQIQQAEQQTQRNQQSTPAGMPRLAPEAQTMFSPRRSLPNLPAQPIAELGLDNLPTDRQPELFPVRRKPTEKDNGRARSHHLRRKTVHLLCMWALLGLTVLALLWLLLR
ncbi:MAG: hypothetical protein N3B01_10550 [Verrucomicrobiae bacterium]|nr:hypothetical protein [Verrucomicrobiae bacterium]